MTAGAALPERLVFVPGSHLDLYWLGSYLTCLDRGADIIKAYLDRCVEHEDETFMIESVVFAAEFVHRHPDYLDTLRALVAAGRVDVSAAYVDRWENLVLPESIIRNVAIGRHWLREHLGHESRVALHPDLPGLNPQTPQLYRSSGIDFYASARKIFGTGRVWQAVAPDGTALLMLRWPGHYNFIPLQVSDIAPDLPRWGDWELELDDWKERFPTGVVPVSGIAGDLTDPADFTARYGRPLRAFLADYAERLPGVDIGFSTPTQILTPYRDGDVEVTRVRGGIPSVWGVSADESAAFFRRSRRNEALLLAAETAAVLGRLEGRALLPPDVAKWRGVFDEDAFFARKDPVAPARAFEDLWRLHVFTQDHNGGGQEGTLSSFQKRVRQARLGQYCREIVGHALGSPGVGLSVFNPTTATGPAHLTIGTDHPAFAALDARIAAAATTNAWRGSDALGAPVLHVVLDQRPAVGTSEVDLLTTPPSRPVTVDDTADRVAVDNGRLRCVVDRMTGAISVHDGGDGSAVSTFGPLVAVPETGNDVTLQTDEAAAVAARLVDVAIQAQGPAIQLRETFRLLDVDWYVTATLRPDVAEADVEIGTRWPGTAGWQIRAPLTDDVASPQVAFGTPYHVTRWDDVPSAATPAVRDEIDLADFRAYREIQHWVQLERGERTVVIATENPGLHLRDGTLSAVLLRTAPSCGDPRFHWDNHGEQRFAFTVSAPASRPDAAVLADALARPPVLVPGPVDARELLSCAGTPLHVGALYADGDDVHVRLVNLHDDTARCELRGVLLRGVDVHAAELDGRHVEGVVSRLDDDTVAVELPAWRVVTLVLPDRLDPQKEKERR